MRLTRASWLVLAALGGAACSHNDAVEIISRDGVNTVPAIDLNTNAAAGLLSGTRAVNKFLAQGAFDTTVFDAFARQTTTVPHFIIDPNGFYGATAGRELYYGPQGATVDSFVPPVMYLPSVIVVGTGQFSYGALYGVTRPVSYIVPGGHAGNGAGNTSWEFWIVIRNLADTTRYVAGLARYALQVRGALDVSEKLLTGTVTQPDSLVFMAGDFTPGGNKGTDNGDPADCGGTDGVPVNGANPYLIAGKRVAVGSASRRIIIDQSVCNSGIWTNGFSSTKSPVPVNNKAPGANQYNFFVVWEALPDSTPNYDRPVWREQIAPVVSTTGALINNGYAPIPAAALTGTQLGPLPGATSRPDTMKLTFNTLKRLSSGAYQVWLLKRGTDTAQLVTGRVVRLAGATVVDTLNGVSEFNTGGTITGARVEFDLAPYTAAAWNSATLTIARTTGNTTLPASQPLWTNAVFKSPGQTASLGGTLVFGSLNKGTGTLVFGAAGGGTGGVFGRELREDILRLPRPPVGYVYEAWLINTGNAATVRNLGPVLAPYPTLTSLVDADTMSTLPLSGTELTQAAVRYVADSIGDLCRRVGATSSFARVYDRVQIRLGPKNGDQNIVSPTIVLNGTLAMAPRTVNDSVKACS